MQVERITDTLWLLRPEPAKARWLALPLVAGGLYLLAGAAGLVAIGSHGTRTHPLILTLLGGGLALLGVIVFFARTELQIDRGAGTITRRSGVPPLMKATSRALGDFAAVSHFRKVVSTGKSTYVVFPVVLGGGTGKEFAVAQCRDQLAARRVAEQVAKVVELDIVDRTDGTERRRQFEDLDLSLREQRQRRGDRPEIGPAPDGMRSRVEIDGDAIDIAIPAYGIRPLHVLALVLATGPIWLVMAFFVAVPRQIPGGVATLGLAFGGVPALLLTRAVLIHAMRRFDVRVSHTELCITASGMRNRMTTVTAERIEEIRVPAASRQRGIDRFFGGGSPIQVFTDDAIVSFGNQLAPSEANYLADIIRGTLSAPVD